MRITLIHNPEAGEGHPSPDELRTALEHAGHHVTYASTKRPGWEAAADGPADMVVAAGGDGTVAKLAPRLAPRGVPLVVLPLGTANNVALTLGLPRDWRDGLAALKGRAVQRFDVGTARGPWGEASFIESVGAGLVSHLIAAADAPPVEAALLAAPRDARLDAVRRLCCRLLTELEDADYSIDADGADLSGRYLIVETMNIRSVGPRIRLAPRADVGDGLLDLVLVEAAARERFVAELESWIDAGAEGDAWPVRRIRRIRIGGERLAWHVDDQLCPGSAAAPRLVPVSGEVTVELTGHIEVMVP